MHDISIYNVYSPIYLTRYGTSDDIVLPQDCKRNGWFAYDIASFVVQPDITCGLVAATSLPAHIQAMADAGRQTCLAVKEAQQQEKLRAPLVGSVIIQGATVDRAKLVNGIYEPTEERCNDMTVYQKKGRPDIWLEMVKSAEGWRW